MRLVDDIAWSAAHCLLRAFHTQYAPSFYGKELEMSEEVQIAPEQQPQGVQVLLDERELRSVYANAYRIHTSSEEVIIDLGFNMPNPNQQAGTGAQLLFKVTDRVILTYG